MQSVYIATNIDYPGLVKIGWYSKPHPSGRMKDLYSAGVLNPWDLYFFTVLENARYGESLIHRELDYCREKSKKEFFRISPEDAKDVLLNITKEILPIEKIYSVKEERKLVRRKRAENIDLFIIGLKLGDILYFCKDQNIVCKVISNKTVLFEGQELTLTEAARKTGLIRQKEIQGPKYWMINGKSLVAVRQEFERVT